jgi:hypothetical protein
MTHQGNMKIFQETRGSACVANPGGNSKTDASESTFTVRIDQTSVTAGSALGAPHCNPPASRPCLAVSAIHFLRCMQKR